jgi:hypothetical protein
LASRIDSNLVPLVAGSMHIPVIHHTIGTFLIMLLLSPVKQ